MPGMNHKGPEGLGPMTGRKMGICTGDTSITEEINGAQTTHSSEPRKRRFSTGETGCGSGHRRRMGRGSGRNC